MNTLVIDLTHGGVKIEELDQLINECHKSLNVQLNGFMIIGPNTDKEEEIEKVFIGGENLLDKYKKIDSSINQLSMGMSEDYKLALKHGATFIRIGSKIFGTRDYSK